MDLLVDSDVIIALSFDRYLGAREFWVSEIRTIGVSEIRRINQDIALRKMPRFTVEAYLRGPQIYTIRLKFNDDGVGMSDRDANRVYNFADKEMLLCFMQKLHLYDCGFYLPKATTTDTREFLQTEIATTYPHIKAICEAKSLFSIHYDPSKTITPTTEDLS